MYLIHWFSWDHPLYVAQNLFVLAAALHSRHCAAPSARRRLSSQRRYAACSACCLVSPLCALASCTRRMCFPSISHSAACTQVLLHCLQWPLGMCSLPHQRLLPASRRLHACPLTALAEVSLLSVSDRLSSRGRADSLPMAGPAQLPLSCPQVSEFSANLNMWCAQCAHMNTVRFKCAELGINIDLLLLLVPFCAHLPKDG